MWIDENMSGYSLTKPLTVPPIREHWFPSVSRKVKHCSLTTPNFIYLIYKIVPLDEIFGVIFDYPVLLDYVSVSNISTSH
jgi:hypothetical protein